PLMRRSNRSLHHRPSLFTSQIRRGTLEESRLEARYLLVLSNSRLRLCPKSSDPRQGRRPARRVVWSEVSLLFHHRRKSLKVSQPRQVAHGVRDSRYCWELAPCMFNPTLPFLRSPAVTRS